MQLLWGFILLPIEKYSLLRHLRDYKLKDHVDNVFGIVVHSMSDTNIMYSIFQSQLHGEKGAMNVTRQHVQAKGQPLERNNLTWHKVFIPGKMCVWVFRDSVYSFNSLRDIKVLFVYIKKICNWNYPVIQ